MTNWDNFPLPKPLSQIFSIESSPILVHELAYHCFVKRERFSEDLNEVESKFDVLQGIGGRIAGDGFISLFAEYFTPQSFAQACSALSEVGAVELRDLLSEAWSIYTKENASITTEALYRIPVRRFNTKDKMDRFDAVGLEVEAEWIKQYEAGKVAEYAKMHRNEFTPIQGLNDRCGARCGASSKRGQL